MSLQTPSGSDIIAQLAEEKRTWPGWSTIESEPVGKLFPLQSCSLCGCLVCAKMWYKGSIQRIAQKYRGQGYPGWRGILSRWGIIKHNQVWTTSLCYLLLRGQSWPFTDLFMDLYSCSGGNQRWTRRKQKWPALMVYGSPTRSVRIFSHHAVPAYGFWLGYGQPVC